MVQISTQSPEKLNDEWKRTFEILDWQTQKSKDNFEIPSERADYLNISKGDIVELEIKGISTEREIPELKGKFKVGDDLKITLSPDQQESFDDCNRLAVIINRVLKDLEGDAPLKFPPDIESRIAQIQRELAIDSEIIRRIISNLVMGKSIILTGAPGTGKTALAKMIPEIFFNIYPETVTATSEWTTFEVIGGIFPEVRKDEEGEEYIGYTIRRGYVYDAIMKNWKLDEKGDIDRDSDNNPIRNINISGEELDITGSDRMKIYRGVWLIIDEFNRADIDKAFGDLFTALEYKKLKVPVIDKDKPSRTIPIPEDFRIIGTLNTFDKHYLFDISDALKRRFAFIELTTHPEEEREKEIVLERVVEDLARKDIEIDPAHLEKSTNTLFSFVRFVRAFRTIGTAQLITCLSYVGVQKQLDKDEIESLQEAVISNILPQLEGLPQEQLEYLKLFAAGNCSGILDNFERELRRNATKARFRKNLLSLTKYLRDISAEYTLGRQKAEAIIREVENGISSDEVDRVNDILTGGGDRRSNWKDIFSEVFRGEGLPLIEQRLEEMIGESII